MNAIAWKCYTAGDPYPYRCSTRSNVTAYIETMLRFCEDTFGPGLATKSYPDLNAKWRAACHNIGLDNVEFGFREEADLTMFICRF